MNVTRYQPGPRMSQAVAAGGLLFTAGQVAEGPDVATQATAILAEIDRLLAAAGTSKEQLVNTSVWLTDLTDFAAFNAIWDAWIEPGHAPARATVVSQLVLPQFKIEIAVVAALPS